MEQETVILIVDDDPDVTDLLEVYLVEEGYKVFKAHNVAKMWEIKNNIKIDLVLVDIGLPDGNGLDIIRKLRSEAQTAVIIISKKIEAVDQIVGLELGADDYVPKPLDPRHLLARIRSVLRRYAGTKTPKPEIVEPEQICFGKWHFDPNTYRLTSETGEETVLSASESALLRHLVANEGTVMSRDELMVITSGRNWEYMDRSIDILIARLRKKIEKDPDHPATIKTVRGAGYVFKN